MNIKLFTSRIFIVYRLLFIVDFIYCLLFTLLATI